MANTLAPTDPYTTRVRNFEVEYPTTMNGHRTRCTGFIIPLGYGPSQFFMVHDDHITYDMPEAVPAYLKRHLSRRFHP
jgi:hypothetical protein